MRTISENLKKRMEAQAGEADFQGLQKLAENLNHTVKSCPTRSDEEEYVYSNGDLRKDVERSLWMAAIRVQDYFNKTADAKDLDELISIHADELIETIRTKIGGGVIGPHEPFVPGERRLVVEIDESHDE